MGHGIGSCKVVPVDHFKKWCPILCCLSFLELDILEVVLHSYVVKRLTVSGWHPGSESWHHKGSQVTAELMWPQAPLAPLPTLAGETHPCHSCPGGPSGQDLSAASPALLISAAIFLGGLPCFTRLRLAVPWPFLCNWSVVNLQYHVSFRCTAQCFSYMFESVSHSVMPNSLPPYGL